jgi:hypothetical protein
MTCHHCGATMLPCLPLRHESNQDYRLDTNDVRTDGPAWRCYTCGAYADAVILRHRATRHEAMVAHLACHRVTARLCAGRAA